jgi:hypothetical protein
LGASPRVTEALRHTYARWDGRVFPDLPQGEQQSAIARLVHLVHVAMTYDQIGGITTVNTRAGTTLFALEHDLVQIQSG